MKLKIYKETVYEEVEVPFELPFYWCESNNKSDEDDGSAYMVSIVDGKYHKISVKKYNYGNYWNISREIIDSIPDWLQFKIKSEFQYSDIRKTEFEEMFSKAIVFIYTSPPTSERKDIYGATKKDKEFLNET